MTSAHRVLFSLALAFAAACSAPGSSGPDATLSDASLDASLAETAPPVEAAVDAAPPVDPLLGLTPPAGPDYRNAGPLPVASTTAMLTLPATTGCTGMLCNVTVEATYPTAGDATRAAPFPLLVFSNGFASQRTFYTYYATRMASWGYVVLRYDLQGESFLNAATHNALANAVVSLIGWAEARNSDATSPLAGRVDVTRTVLAGHSRGGKVSALAASRSPNVRAVFGLDPVDSPPPGTQPNADYPLGSRALADAGRDIPFAAVGAELGGRLVLGMACAPPAYNYATFYDAARGRGLEVVLADVGHGQFIVGPAGAAANGFCPAGAVTNDRVAALTTVLLLAWSERIVRSVDTDAWLTGAWAGDRTADGTYRSLRSR